MKNLIPRFIKALVEVLEWVDCNNCYGRGYIGDEQCDICYGRGQVWVD